MSNRYSKTMQTNPTGGDYVEVKDVEAKEREMEFRSIDHPVSGLKRGIATYIDTGEMAKGNSAGIDSQEMVLASLRRIYNFLQNKNYDRGSVNMYDSFGHFDPDKMEKRQRDRLHNMMHELEEIGTIVLTGGFGLAESDMLVMRNRFEREKEQEVSCIKDNLNGRHAVQMESIQVTTDELRRKLNSERKLKKDIKSKSMAAKAKYEKDISDANKEIDRLKVIIIDAQVSSTEIDWDL